MEKIKIVFSNGDERFYAYTERAEDADHIRLLRGDGAVITITKSEVVSEENNPANFAESPTADA